MAELVVGILGGMGPAATVDLQQRIIAATPARDDNDHLHVIVDNNAKVPSRIKALLEGTGESPAPCMASMARRLVASGAQLLAMPCNTAHHYYEEVAMQVNVPFLNIIDVVANHFAHCQPRPMRIGMLASTAVQRIKLYDSGLNARGMQAIFPEEAWQDQLMNVIRAVKAGANNDEDLSRLADAAANLEGQGVDALLIACTELSALGSTLASVNAQSRVPIFDAAQLLAEEIVRTAKNG